MKTIIKQYARKCDITGQGMNKGYLIQDVLMYIKEDIDFLDYITNETDYNTIEEAYKDGFYFWTEWEDEDDFQYQEINGKLIEIN